MVYWDAASDGQYYTVKQVSTGGSNTAIITDLSPGQLYNFIIVAVNAHGIGN